MAGGDMDFDITKNIRVIERLKCDILASVSGLYDCLLNNQTDAQERTEKLSEIILYTYLLSNRLGIPNEHLDSKLINKIRIEVLKDHPLIKNDLVALLRHLEE